MKITGHKKFNVASTREKTKLNELLIKSNIALNAVGGKLEKSATIVYTASVIATSISTLLALISNNNKLQTESNLYLKAGILNKMMDALNSENQKSLGKKNHL